MAQREQGGQTAQHGGHSGRRIGEPRQREREDAPQRRQTHRKAHLAAENPEQKDAERLRGQHGQDTDAHHRRDPAIARKSHEPVEINVVKEDHQHIQHRLRQQFADQSRRHGVIGHAEPLALRPLFPLQSDRVGRREHDEQDQNARQDDVREVDGVVQRRVVERMRLDDDGTDHGHRRPLIVPFGIERLAGQRQRENLGGGHHVLHQQGPRHEIGFVGVERHAGLFAGHRLFGRAFRNVEESVYLAPLHRFAGFGEGVVLIREVRSLERLHRACEDARDVRAVLIDQSHREAGRQTGPHQRREEDDADHRHDDHAEQEDGPAGEDAQLPPENSRQPFDGSTVSHSISLLRSTADMPG